MSEPTNIIKRPSLNDTFQVWWWIGWRAALIGVVWNLAVGFLSGLLLKSIAEDTVMAVVNLILVVQVIGNILISILVMQRAFNRDYKGFRLSLNKKTQHCGD